MTRRNGPDDMTKEHMKFLQKLQIFHEDDEIVCNDVITLLCSL